MRTRKFTRNFHAVERGLTARQRAILAVTVSDERYNAWALEMLDRRNAVARWRGQPSCSIREVMQALEALPARHDRARARPDVFRVIEPAAILVASRTSNLEPVEAELEHHFRS